MTRKTHEHLRKRKEWKTRKTHCLVRMRGSETVSAASRKVDTAFAVICKRVKQRQRMQTQTPKKKGGENKETFSAREPTQRIHMSAKQSTHPLRKTQRCYFFQFGVSGDRDRRNLIFSWPMAGDLRNGDCRMGDDGGGGRRRESRSVSKSSMRIASTGSRA